MISQLLIYSLKAALTLTLLYVPYTLMLQKEKFFHLNRIVLLSIIAFSLVLPLCNVSWMSLDNNPIVQATHQQMIEVGIPVRVAEDDITVSYQLAGESTSLSWFIVLAIVFFAGMAVSVVIRCLQLGVLSYMMRHKNLWAKRREDGTRVCCRKGSFTPYSWMHTIVISEEDWNDGRREILLHETGHIRAHHSWDMLLLMLCQALQWYNPFAWMIGNSLSDLHEYEADDYVLRQGVRQKDYMMLLVKKVVQSQGYSFVNGLNKSTLKKRILMMKEKAAGSRWMHAKLLYLLPVCALVLSAFSTPNFTAPVEEALAKLESQPSQPDILPVGKNKGGDNDMGGESFQSIIPEDCLPLQGTEIGTSEHSATELEPLFVVDGKVVSRSELFDVDPVTASEDKLAKHLHLNPKDIVSVTILRGTSATSVWGERGKNGAIEITTIHAAENQDETEEAKTESDFLLEDIVSRIPNAKIGADGSVYVDGKKVEKLIVNGKEQLDGNQSASETEVQPVLQDEGQMTYSQYARYPMQAIENAVQGKVMVDFYVETDGTISDVKASKYDGHSTANLSELVINTYGSSSQSAKKELSEEEQKGKEDGVQALLSESERVVKLTSGKWTPGYSEDAQGNRTPKRMKMSMPLNFRFN